LDNLVEIKIICNKNAMDSNMPIDEAQKNQEQKWYKKWWVILIAIIVMLPFFWFFIPVGLIVLIWTRQWSNGGKIAATIGFILFLMTVLVIIGSNASTKTQTTSKEQKQEIAKNLPIDDKKEDSNTGSMAQVVEQNDQITEEKNAISENSSEIASQNEKVEEVQDIQKTPNYEVVYTINNKYGQGEIDFGILIDPVDVQSNYFKEDIKFIVTKVVQEKGKKVSIDILDDKKTLGLYQKSHYAQNTLGRILTQDEMELIGDHLVASFSGQFGEEIVQNSLSFFPATGSDNPRVGKYVETLKFEVK
jgi:hypothetical protein